MICDSYDQYGISKVMYTAADEPEVLTTGGNDDMTTAMSKQNATVCSNTEKVRLTSSSCIVVSRSYNKRKNIIY